MHMQALYKNCEYITNNDEDVSRKLFEQGLCLQSGSNLSDQDQDKIISTILSHLKN